MCGEMWGMLGGPTPDSASATGSGTADAHVQGEGTNVLRAAVLTWQQMDYLALGACAWGSGGRAVVVCVGARTELGGGHFLWTPVSRHFFHHEQADSLLNGGL